MAGQRRCVGMKFVKSLMKVETDYFPIILTNPFILLKMCTIFGKLILKIQDTEIYLPLHGEIYVWNCGQLIISKKKD